MKVSKNGWLFCQRQEFTDPHSTHSWSPGSYGIKCAYANFSRGCRVTYSLEARLSGPDRQVLESRLSSQQATAHAPSLTSALMRMVRVRPIMCAQRSDQHRGKQQTLNRHEDGETCILVLCLCE